MGVKGFSHYIQHRSRKYLSKHKLQDTYLVIDGNSLIFYILQSKGCSFHFGGDYDEFASYLGDFFDQLIACNVTALIIIDGAMEDKKYETHKARAKSRFEKIKTLPSSKAIFMPLMSKDVFKYIAKCKNVICVQSTFEADNIIASVAKILNCPVLSNDSDFFFYGIDYISFDSLAPEISSLNGKYFKDCEIFRSKYLLKSFGIDVKVLPLAAVLLGNDYISQNVFKNFFLTLKVPQKVYQMNSGNRPHLRIEAVFKWLGKQKNLNCAIAQVLHTIDPEKSQIVTEIIEIILNGYLNISSELLHALRFPVDFVHYVQTTMSQNFYKFQYPKNYKYIEPTAGLSDNEVLLQLPDLSDISDSNECLLKPKKNVDIKKIIPSWFKYEYNMGNLPCHFLDMIIRQEIFTSAMVEDCSYPTAFNISLKIISTIFQLISQGTCNCDVLKYYARGKDVEMIECKLDVKNNKLPFKVPKLESLMKLPMETRRQIFDYTLGVIETESILEFPPPWRLYIIVIKYWLQEAQENFRTNYHLYSLIFIMILSVIRKVITYGSYFEATPDGNNKKIVKKHIKINGPLLEDLSVYDALKKINLYDCMFILPFFDSLYLANYKNFDMSIIHAFILLQNATKSGMHLNSLLGHPYPAINVAEFFNGTLSYNLYNHFKKYDDPSQCVIEILNNAPSILQLFVSIVTKF